jgi:hypothetical protein
MHIFNYEKEDGLEAVLQSTASISYASHIQPCDSDYGHSVAKTLQSLASYKDEDLYYVQSILVSTSWNKNDDIFDKAEVWSAKNTPEDKPTNLEHDESVIIGHITSNWPITEDGILIDENTPIDNLPDKYHILTGSVIYRAYTSNDLRDRAEKLISEIKDGKKYVSMECFFKGFDYGLLDISTGSYSVLPRNESTAYLTKHLRAYGGMGQHENYKIGRVLRNITFSGKGFVDKPANPDSIIFNLDNLFNKKNSIFANLGVSNNQFNSNTENNTMSVDLEKEVAELKDKVESVSAGCADTVKEAYSLATELQNKTITLEAAVKNKDKELEEKDDEMKKMKAEFDETLANKAAETEELIKAKEEALSQMQAELSALTETLAGYKAKEEDMLKKEKKMKRVAELMENGLEQELALSTADQFEALDDSTFSGLSSLIAAMSKRKAEKMEEDKKDEEMLAKKKASEATTIDETVLDSVETEETVDLSVGGQETDAAIESTRSALVEFVYNRLGKTLNKGE